MCEVITIEVEKYIGINARLFFTPLQISRFYTPTLHVILIIVMSRCHVSITFLPLYISDNQTYEINGHSVIMEFPHFTHYSLQDIEIYDYQREYV